MKLTALAIGVLSAALLGGQASAVETDYSAASLALPTIEAEGTARSMAMGSAVAAVPDGSASVLWNPAGLAQMACTELGLHTNEGLGNTVQELGVFGTPLGKVDPSGGGGSLGGLAISIGYVNYGSFQGRDATGLPTGNYQASGLSGSVGWGIQILPGLSAGADVKADQSDFAGENYNSYAADLGLLYALLPSLNLGVSYSNINLGNNIPGGELAQGWRLGAAYTLDHHLLLAVSGELQSHNVNSIQAGAEYLIGNVEEKVNVLALRAGYQFNYPDPQLTGLNSLTFGIGYSITRTLALDYAYVPAGELGNTQELSLTFRFDCPCAPQKTPPPAAAAAVPATMVAAAPVAAPAPVAVAPRPIVLQSILLGDEHFDFDKATLTASGVNTLMANIQILKDNPKARVRVAGYTSMEGTADYNQLLSQRRAAAVEEFLVEQGRIDPSRITTIGYGATDPATYEPHPGDVNSAAAKSNMRVLFEVTVK